MDFSILKDNRGLWLIPLAVAAVMAILSTILYNVVLDSTDSTNRTYQTAIKIDNDAEKFNYSVETRQGVLLSYGEYQSVKPVKFKEMTKSFMYVRKVKEEYTQHTETYSCGKSTCTRTYYTWDEAGEEEVSSPTVRLFGKSYPSSTFDFNKYERVDAKDIVKNETEDYYYPDRKKIWILESEGDVRYYYEVVQNKTLGSMLTNTSNGLLEPAEDKTLKVYDKTISERLDDVKSRAEMLRWVFVIGSVLMTLFVSGLIFYWLDYNY